MFSFLSWAQIWIRIGLEMNDYALCTQAAACWFAVCMSALSSHLVYKADTRRWRRKKNGWFKRSKINNWSPCKMETWQFEWDFGRVVSSLSWRPWLTVLGLPLLQLLPELLPLLLHPAQLLAAPPAEAVQPLSQSVQPVPLQEHRLHLGLQLLGTAEVITCTGAPRGKTLRCRNAR